MEEYKFDLKEDKKLQLAGYTLEITSNWNYAILGFNRDNGNLELYLEEFEYIGMKQDIPGTIRSKSIIYPREYASKVRKFIRELSDNTSL